MVTLNLDVPLDNALSGVTDVRSHVMKLARIWDGVMSGTEPIVKVRPVVAESWQRIKRLGIDPERGEQIDVARRCDLEELRRASGLIPVLDLIQRSLTSIANDGVHVMVLTDRTGRILWQEGHTSVRSRAERLGFVEGAHWLEPTVGTNGIGTGLYVNRPVQIFGPEHYVRSHHGWVCTAAPILDPKDGSLLGVADIAGPIVTAHATTLALVDSVARLAGAALRMEHQASLARLQALAAPTLLRMKGPALVVDRYGWVAAAVGVKPCEHVVLPETITDAPVRIPALGNCQIEPFWGAWLIRIGVDEEESPFIVRLQLTGKNPLVTLIGRSGSSTQQVTTRHAEILYILAGEPNGRTGAELSTDLYGDDRHTAAVRAEISRLRSSTGILIDDRPYRLPTWLQVSVESPDDPGSLLPRSTAPAICRRRLQPEPHGD